MRGFFLTVLVGGIVAAVPGLVASAQPLLQYRFDEPSGQALDTGVPPPANGDLLGGAVRSSDTPGGFGSSVDFNTETPYAHVLEGDADKLDGLNQLTLTTWLKVSAYPSGNHRLSSKQNAGTFGGFSWNMNAAPNDGPVGPDNFRLGLFLGNNVSSGASDFGFAFSNADAGADETWAFLAVTYDNSLATDNTVFYMGGVGTPVQQLGTPVTIPQLTIDGGPAPFGVGFTHAAPAANTSVLGFQDDVRVYGTALDPAALEVVRLSNIPEPGSLGVLAIACAALLARRRRG